MIYSTHILWADTVCQHYSKYYGYSSDSHRQSSTPPGRLDGHNEYTFKHVISAEIIDLERKIEEWARYGMTRIRLPF